MRKNIFIASLLIAIVLFGLLIYSLVMYNKYPVKFKSDIYSISAKYNIEKSLIYAIIKVESNFDNNAVSSAGACGLMQIMPSTASWMAEKYKIDYNDIFDIKQNLEIGCCYLRYLFNKFGAEWIVVCAYNAGEGNVAVWIKNNNFTQDTIPFVETQDYLNKVFSVKEKYKNII